LNLGRYKLTFFLLNLVLAWRWKGRETLADNGQPREAGKQPLNGLRVRIEWGNELKWDRAKWGHWWSRRTHKSPF